MGVKCHDEGIKVSIVEDIAEIRKYKDTFISNTTEDEDNEINNVIDLISEHKVKSAKTETCLGSSK